MFIWQGYNTRLGSQVRSNLDRTKSIIGKGGGASVPERTYDSYYLEHINDTSDNLINRYLYLLNNPNKRNIRNILIETQVIDNILEERGIILPNSRLQLPVVGIDTDNIIPIVNAEIIDNEPILNAKIVNNEEDDSELPKAEIRKPKGRGLKPIIGKGGGASVPLETYESYYSQYENKSVYYLLDRYDALIRNFDRNFDRNPETINLRSYLLEKGAIENILRQRGFPVSQPMTETKR